MKIVYVVCIESHFSNISNEREKEYLAKLLGLSTRGWTRAYEL